MLLRKPFQTRDVPKKENMVKFDARSEMEHPMERGDEVGLVSDFRIYEDTLTCRSPIKSAKNRSVACPRARERLLVLVTW